MRLLHAIHDFLPRHRAGSELYAAELAAEQRRRGHDVHVLCAEYDPARPHGSVTRRAHDGLPVLEVVNNWVAPTFDETWRPPALVAPLRDALRELKPDVLHLHSLLNLSFDLPELARAEGIPTVATLHDFSLVCPSGGQRVHVAERHVCARIDPARCARCFPQSPLHAQLVFGRAVRGPLRGPALSAIRAVRALAPRAFARVEALVPRLSRPGLTEADVARRLEARHRVFAAVEHFVAPSAALAEAFVELGLPEEKLSVSDYGFAPLTPAPRRPRGERLRIGFVGTLAWHKGAHLLLEAARALPPGRFELSLHGNLATFPGYVAALRRQAEGLPVTFAGAFDGSPAPVYAGLDLLVVPSLWPENSPLVIHEAFMCGVPVVGARLGGIPGLVRHEETGWLFEPGAADDLARQLRRALDEPALLERCAASLPTVKTIAADAAEWDARYQALRLAPAA